MELNKDGRKGIDDQGETSANVPCGSIFHFVAGLSRVQIVIDERQPLLDYCVLETTRYVNQTDVARVTSHEMKEQWIVYNNDGLLRTDDLHVRRYIKLKLQLQVQFL